MIELNCTSNNNAINTFETCLYPLLVGATVERIMGLISGMIAEVVVNMLLSLAKYAFICS